MRPIEKFLRKPSQIFSIKRDGINVFVEKNPDEFRAESYRTVSPTEQRRMKTKATRALNRRG